MKRTTILISLLFSIAALFAQAPEKFSYQAVIRNASNQLITNSPVGVRISVLHGGVVGTLIYMETHIAVTNENGLITLLVGSGNLLQGDFTSIDWANGLYYLKTEIDPAGGTNYSITSTQQLLSVPYALYANEAGNGFSGDYNDLTNKPSIPTIPSNVSAFTNDVGYLTSFTEQQVLSISHDTVFLTGGSFVKLPAGFDGDYNSLTNKPTLFSGNYNDLTNTPTVPTIPSNVSAFTNDVGYLTDYTETDPQFNAWDKNYNDLINKPVIPTVPTNVSAFTNDAGYISGYTETDPQFNAWDKDYNDLINKPSIPTVPTNVSAFANDAGYLTSFTEQQVLNISNDTIFLTGGSFVKLPEGFNGDYNSLTNKPNLFSGDYNDLSNTPQIPQIPTNVSYFNNDVGYITMDSLPTIPSDVSAFNNDAGYLTSYTENQTLADVTAIGNSAGSRQLKEVSDPTESYDAVNLRTLILMIDSLRAEFQQQQEDMQHQIDSLKDVINSLHPITDSFVCGTSTVTDYDGNTYNTVQIGVQCWMKENLRTTHYADGTAIPYNGSLSNTDPYYYNYSSDIVLAQRGYLYNWPAAMHGDASSGSNPNNVQGVCPDGWHLPSDAEWTQLTDYVSGQSEYTCAGNSNNIAKALASETGWNSYSGECYPGDQSVYTNNATGFSAVPAGGVTFETVGNYSAYFWSSSEVSVDRVWTHSLGYRGAFVNRYNYSKDNGFSVRCLRDATNGGTSQTQPSVTTGEATNITSNSATLNGTISNPDNVTIIAQGFEWKTNQDTTYTVISTTGETFSYNFSGLSPNTSYIYRAFVNTSEETHYGEEKSFITSCTGPIVIITAYEDPDLYANVLTASGAVNYIWNTGDTSAIIIASSDVDTLYSVIGIDSYGCVDSASIYVLSIRHDGQPCPGTPTVTDIDGNVYNTVQIGTQCWLKENLKSTHYADGTSITHGSDTSTTIAYYYYPDGNASNVTDYGLLYNWRAAMGTSSSSDANPSGVQGVCPDGWHIPSVEEWDQLYYYVKGQSEYVCGEEITKALASQTGWDTSDVNCTPGNNPSSNNVTGFSALPAGGYGWSYPSLRYYEFGQFVSFCSSTEWSWHDDVSYDFSFEYNDAIWGPPGSTGADKYRGISVRCLRD